MEMTGERRIPASRAVVWQALNDPASLQAAIPGCEEVIKLSGDELSARVAVKIGPMAAKMNGRVRLSNLNAPESYTISGEGNGGAMGFAKGGADVRLEALGPEETLLTYTVKAQVGGKMAQLGARLIDTTAKQMADQFFDRLAANLSRPTGPDHETGNPAALAKPEPAKPMAIEILKMPPEIFGMPIIFWAGSAVFLLFMYLIFLSS